MATSSNHVSSLKLNEIPATFQSGIFALKWPEDAKKTQRPTVVHLSIDIKGFYLICLDKITRKIECFDIALIHDTRTGSQVSLPQDAEYCDEAHMGALDVSLTSKWLTIYYGDTFVPSSDLRILHFSCKSPNIAQEWAEQLFRFGHNQILRNLSNLECLEKLHSKIIHSLIDLDKKTISVGSLIQFLRKNTREEIKKIHQALEYLKLPHKTDSVINSKDFTFDVFFRFYMHLMERHEIDTLFNSMGGKRRGDLSRENVKEFIIKQDDARGDHYRMDHYEQKTRDLINKYRQDDEHSGETGMCYESFLKYLLSFDNLIIDPAKFDLFMNMDKPLAHYFISSSHNTYLTGSQWNGRASTEMYRQVLLTGCRCIELDVVDSEKDEPEIKHIHTRVRPVPFIDVIVAIRDYAFKVTPYPLTLSLENHCGPKAQAKMAQYLIDVFREKLIIKPLKTHPCEENYPLPSPNDLRNKILIKNKKLQSHSTSKVNNQTVQRPVTIISTSSSELSTDISTVSSSPTQSSDGSFRRHQTLNANPRHGFLFEDENSSDEDRPVNELNPNEIQSSNSDALPESRATRAMSDLVHYIVPVRFKTFAQTKERNRCFEMSSFSEDKAQSLIRDHAKDFLAYNQRQISRIYPRGTRLESSNYNPYIFWPIGCQMAALNYQTLDIPMQLNLGLFSFNAACGYIEKPSILCQSRSLFDPRVRINIENVVGYDISIKVLSGQFLCQNREPSFVDIQMYGMYGDATKRNEYHVRAKRWNGFQAIYDDTDIDSNEFTIRFSKIILPEMAALRFAVSAEDGVFIGQCFIPVAHLRSGYRHIVLRNQINIPVRASSLFIFIQKKIYINAKDQEFANRLADPLTAESTTSNKLQQNLDNEKNPFDNLSSDVVLRCHNSLISELGGNIKQGNPSIPLEETNWYQKHAIAGSEFNDRKRLCRILSLNDIKPEELVKREQTIHVKLRRISVDYQKKIQKEQDTLEKYLNVQSEEIHPHRNRPRTTNSTINKKDIEQIEQRLLKLYSKKFHQQEYLECEYLNEYYDKLEKEIKDDYSKQIIQICNILKKEKSRVEENVRLQTRQEADAIKRTETDRDRLAMLKDKSSQMNTKVGALTIRTLEEMYEQVKEILQINLQTNLNQLGEKKCMEIEKCCSKYLNQMNQLEIRLQRQWHSDEYDIPCDDSSSPFLPRTAGASLSTVSYFSSEVITSEPQTRRQTMQ